VTDVVVSTLVIIGSCFMFLAAIGVVRMPDLYMRMSTVTKAATMGAGMLLLATVFDSGDPAVIIKAAAVVTFGFFTSPITAHIVSRAAYFQGVPLWRGTLIDQLGGQYDPGSHRLESPDRG
jgi:multicomponent Na+:H+ antiporter subunit G